MSIAKKYYIMKKKRKKTKEKEKTKRKVRMIQPPKRVRKQKMYIS